VVERSVINSRLPLCPDCGSGLPYVRINLIEPFDCPFCGKTLVVSPEYTKRIRQVTFLVAIVLTIFSVFFWKNILLFILAPILGFFISAIAHFVAKRFFPPEIEDNESPKYVAL